MFDDSWEHEEETGDEGTYDYYTKGDVTVCVYAGIKSVTIQIMEPSEPTPVPPTPGEPVTITTSIADYASDNGWENGEKYLTVEMDDVITAEGSDGSTSSEYYTSDNSWRFYESDSGILTISAADGYVIQSVTLTFGVKDSGKMLFDGSAIASGKAVDVNDSTAVFSASGGGKGKVFVTSISVTYVAE